MRDGLVDNNLSECDRLRGLQITQVPDVLIKAGFMSRYSNWYAHALPGI